GRQIAGLTHDWAERGAQQRLRLLLDKRDQARPHRLEPDRRHSVAGAHMASLSPPLRSRIRWPRASMLIVKPLVATVVVSSSTTSAGPGTRAPAVKALRS